MAAARCDIAVLGASAFALLLAGQLRAAHGKSVCLVADPWSPYRLPRGFDLSVMPATRPETWALLKRGTAEVIKLLGGVGKSLYERVDPLFVAETEASTDYLGHMRWLAYGLGYSAERALDRAVTLEGTICRIRDAVTLVGGRTEPALEAWLDRLGVARLPARGASLAFPRHAATTISQLEQVTEAETVVLADDDAIIAHLPAAERHRLLSVSPRTSLVTEPAKPLAAPLIHYLDRDLTLEQRQTRGAISAIAAGEADDALPRVGASLASQGRLRRSGQAIFQSVSTTDGAPLLGRMGKGKLLVIAGLGASAAFLAPAVARVIAGTATEEDKLYFEPRDTSKAANRRAIAETAVPEATAAVEPSATEAAP